MMAKMSVSYVEFFADFSAALEVVKSEFPFANPSAKFVWRLLNNPREYSRYMESTGVGSQADVEGFNPLPKSVPGDVLILRQLHHQVNMRDCRGRED